MDGPAQLEPAPAPPILGPTLTLPADCEAAPLRRLWDRLCALAVKRSTLALADQMVVSGTSFLTTVLVGRFAGASELGVYSIGFSIVVLIICLQDSLVMAPYTVFSQRLEGDAQAEYAGSALLLHRILALVALVGLGAAAGVLWLTSGSSRLVQVLFVLSLATPLILMREFRRRLAFAHLQVGPAAIIDVAVMVLQLASLGVLAILGAVSAVTAHGTVGLACALSGGFGLLLIRRNMIVRRETAISELRRSWVFGRWIVCGQMIGVVHGFALYWLLALMLGASATGVFAACMTVVLLSNPFILGMSNILGPHLARAFANGGRDEVRRVAAKNTLILGGMMAGFVALVALFGNDVMRLFYGSEYSGNGLTISLLGLGVLATALGIPTDHGLRALERPDLAFRASFVGLAVTLIAASLLAVWWEMPGAACGAMAGSIAGTAVRVLSFLPLVRSTHPEGRHE
jgi:O-antigen/teichoic acid export membrane protein